MLKWFYSLSFSFVDDHSRVILEKLPNDEHSDYYNASYILVSFKKQLFCIEGKHELTSFRILGQYSSRGCLFKYGISIASVALAAISVQNCPVWLLELCYGVILIWFNIQKYLWVKVHVPNLLD